MVGELERNWSARLVRRLVGRFTIVLGKTVVAVLETQWGSGHSRLGTIQHSYFLFSLTLGCNCKGF